MIKEITHYEFSADKNAQLIAERGISFEDAIAAIHEGAILDLIPHPNLEKYPNQEMYVLNINNYAYIVPFVTDAKGIVFLKTIFPHRKFTQQYLRGENCEK